MSATRRPASQVRPVRAWWTPDQLADYLEVSRRKVDRWIAAGQIRAVALPGEGRGLRIQRRVADAEVRAFEAWLGKGAA